MNDCSTPPNSSSTASACAATCAAHPERWHAPISTRPAPSKSTKTLGNAATRGLIPGHIQSSGEQTRLAVSAASSLVWTVTSAASGRPSPFVCDGCPVARPAEFPPLRTAGAEEGWAKPGSAAAALLSGVGKGCSKSNQDLSGDGHVHLRRTMALGTTELRHEDEARLASGGKYCPSIGVGDAHTDQPVT
jgi:hypothetical protein